MTQKVLLHVGCGPAKEKDVHPLLQGSNWKHVRIDIDVSVSPDIVDDIRTLEKIADDSADGIYSSHNMEHLHLFDVVTSLMTFKRKLRVGGMLCITVPDLAVACRAVIDGRGLSPVYTSAAGPITALDMIFGYAPYTHKNQFQQHKFGFTEKILKDLLIAQGFANIETTTLVDSFDIWAFARRVE